jgi:pyrimidine deaminase RibD-like protein
MSPGRVLRTSAGDRGQARTRRQIAQKYLEVAELAATEATGPSSTVVVGVAVLAGIAAADAICLAATGVRYAGTDHAEAAVLLEQTDRLLGAELARLNRLKPAAHYGSSFIGVNERDQALRASRKLVEAATMRTP